MPIKLPLALNVLAAPPNCCASPSWLLYCKVILFSSHLIYLFTSIFGTLFPLENFSHIHSRNVSFFPSSRSLFHHTQSLAYQKILSLFRYFETLLSFRISDPWEKSFHGCRRRNACCISRRLQPMWSGECLGTYPYLGWWSFEFQSTNSHTLWPDCYTGGYGYWPSFTLARWFSLEKVILLILFCTAAVTGPSFNGNSMLFYFFY